MLDWEDKKLDRQAVNDLPGGIALSKKVNWASVLGGGEQIRQGMAVDLPDARGMEEITEN